MPSREEEQHRRALEEARQKLLEGINTPAPPMQQQMAALQGRNSMFEFALTLLVGYFAVNIFLSNPNTSTPYNATYPLSPVNKSPSGVITVQVAIISDADTQSKESGGSYDRWKTSLITGELSVDVVGETASINLDSQLKYVRQLLAFKGRSMELSELQAFNGKLYTVDDRTGVVYQVVNATTEPKLIPWVLLSNGDGNQTDMFKAEWMTVKDKLLYVGGLGKEWTTTEGEFVNTNPMWVKVVNHEGAVQHRDWEAEYKRLRAADGIQYPGYMIHEAAVWSPDRKRWYFLPRRASNSTYTESADERRASNLLLETDDVFATVSVRRVGKLNPIRGFSSVKFLPESSDSVFVALRTEEDAGRIASYLTVFDFNCKIFLEDFYLGDVKYEGIEFI